MSNLNIQQKVALAAQKSKETKHKDVVLTDAELKQKEWNEVIKPSLTEKQSAQIEEIQAKLAPLGGYKELDVYEIGRKYDWNEVVLESVTNVLLQKFEEAGDFKGWKEVKKPGKSQAPTRKKAKEAEDVRETRPRRNEGRYDRYEEEIFGGRRNGREESGDFKRRAQRGQSVEAGGRRNYQRERGGRHDDFQDRYYEREQYGNRYEPSRRRYNRDERYEDDQRTDRRDFANRVRNRNKEIITYVRKVQQDEQPQERREEIPENHERQEKQERHERPERQERHERPERYERHERQEKQERYERPERHERQEKNESQQLESHVKQEERREEREKPKHREKSKNREQNSRKQQPVEVYEGKGRYGKVIYVPKNASQNTQEQQQTEETTSSRRTNRYTEKTMNHKETTNASQAKKEVPSSSNTTGSNANVRHYDQNNIHEFFRNNAGLTESPKKEAHRETEKTEIIHKPKQEEKKAVPLPRVDNDYASQTVQKPVLGFNDNKQKEKTPQQQNEAHNQPIGHQRSQNTQATAHNTFGSHQTHASHQTHQSHPTHQTQTSHSTQQNTQNVSTQGSQIDNQQQQQQQYFLQQQQYMMSQFPQQGFFNPYMYFQQPQGFGTAGNNTKGEQAQTYPPGFNPQEIPNIYQMPMILIPQPNGPPIFQPMYSMMAPPTNVGFGGQTKVEGDQQKNFQQPYYQLPMMSMPTEYYGVDDKKQSQGQYDTGSFFNFQANEGDFKKNHNSNPSGFQQQGMGFPMIPTHQMGQFPYQQFQAKGHDNSGSHAWK